MYSDVAPVNISPAVRTLYGGRASRHVPDEFRLFLHLLLNSQVVGGDEVLSHLVVGQVNGQSQFSHTVRQGKLFADNMATKSNNNNKTYEVK